MVLHLRWGRISSTIYLLTEDDTITMYRLFTKTNKKKIETEIERVIYMIWYY